MRTAAFALMLALLSALTASAAPRPAAWFRFDGPAPGHDSADREARAAVEGAQSCPGHSGAGIRLDGTGGLTVPGAPHAGGGFALECWVRFERIGESMCIAAREGEYLLRVDPGAEGGNISFFVNAGGSLEPRVRGPVARPGVWYHLAASWDGVGASLWVNGRQHRAARSGAIPASDAPARVGAPSQWGPVGLRGALDEVKLYDRPLTDGDVLERYYDIRPARGAPLRLARFEFAGGAEGWEARGASGLRAEGGCLRAASAGELSLLLRRGLNVPAVPGACVTLRMAVSRGETARLVLLTDAGLLVAPIAVRGDSAMHTYVVRADDYPEWRGRLRALGVAPSEAAARVSLDFVRLAGGPDGPPEIAVERLLPRDVVNRAGRDCVVTARLRNDGGPGRGLRATLSVPPGARVTGRAERRIARLGYGNTATLRWSVRAAKAGTVRLRVRVEAAGMTPARAEAGVPFLADMRPRKLAYIPEPRPPASRYLVGAHYCPLWKQGSRADGWERIAPYPEREPALGWYDENDPEVTDWEIKWALEHGIDFFVYCWYRDGQGGPVKSFLGHAIHEGLFNARFASRFQFAIMWENQQRGHAGVSSEQDLLENLLPYWIENYFRRPEYLRVAGKPLLFIYRPEFLVDDLGGVEQVRRAFDRMREACKRAGLGGLTILGEYRGVQPDPLRLMADEGADAAFAYCWPVAGHAGGREAIEAQEGSWTAWRRMGILPGLLTVSMGWDPRPWHPSSSIWRLRPDEFREACERARQFMDALPEDDLAHRMVLLDNWNEYGEGHYIAPHRQYGFGYLDAVRSVFTDDPKRHDDLVPQDIGRGPYDSRFRAVQRDMERCAERVTAPGGDEPGLLGWWSFDDRAPQVALDWSGHRAGAAVHDAGRVPGRIGQALGCNGGCAMVAAGTQRFGLRAITVECWVRTNAPDQTDRWFVNSVYGDGGSGFRLGLNRGRLCWAVPDTPWSHHLQTEEPLPLGRWVHVVGTCDGTTMRLYMDGVEVAHMARAGRVRGNDYGLCLGSYAIGHRAHFTGVLDEVRIYGRALSAAEIRRRAAR
ncbi:MAG: glycoside hydrolase family 99-like domain-containing protein [Chthonomonadales bacterium]|nr:glycoside hydrolase family 99-like domain-containing protein [Chthonomonadales bacterium]